MASNHLRVALLQLTVIGDTSETIQKARTAVKKAADNGAHVVCLPGGFFCPKGSAAFLNSAEAVPGQASQLLSDMAKENHVYLVGGTMLEMDGGNMFKTCLVHGPDGSMVAKYRKLHMFDIDIPGKITFRESDFITPGDALTVFETPFCKVGIGICYDVRFADLAQVYADLGCDLLVFPSAFNLKMGSLHWELLHRARAADNQIYVAAVSPARVESSSYVTWGHSMLIDPLGEVIQSAGCGEAVVIAEVDLDYLRAVRMQSPLTGQRRNDLYKLVRCDPCEDKERDRI